MYSDYSCLRDLTLYSVYPDYKAYVSAILRNDWTPSDMAERYHEAYEMISSVLNSKNKIKNSK